MTYLDAVLEFTSKIVNEYARKKNRGHDLSEEARSDWNSHKIALDKHFTDVSKHSSSEHKIAWYALALNNAATYLSVKTDKMPENEKKKWLVEEMALQTHINKINEKLPSKYRKLKIEVPLHPAAIFEPSAENKIEEEAPTILRKCPEVLRFLNSEQFGALEKYQTDVLTNDKRSHKYLCYFDLSERRKADILNDLLTNLSRQQTMSGIKKVLENFYDGKNQQMRHKDSPEFDKSPYEILNLGQNITTRFFNRLGMRSTTITLLDDLAATVGMGNKAVAVKTPSLV
ncbi:MAG: hypothetical protein Q8M03_02835 [Legionella sp.]|nr:hypothetical protein [Legionella sp.]